MKLSNVQYAAKMLKHKWNMSKYLCLKRVDPLNLEIWLSYNCLGGCHSFHLLICFCSCISMSNFFPILNYFYYFPWTFYIFTIWRIFPWTFYNFILWHILPWTFYEALIVKCHWWTPWIKVHDNWYFYYLTYFSMNFLWNSDRKVSLMKPLFFLASSPLAQFLNTTSSSHLSKWEEEIWSTDLLRHSLSLSVPL